MSDNVSKEIRSMVTNDGNIELSIKTSEIPTPSADEVIIKVKAAPINPSDLGLLLSFAADISSISTTGSGDETVTTMKIHPALMGAMKPRLDESMQVGNEGAGVVVDAGDNVKDLIGKTVGLAGGAMYSQSLEQHKPILTLTLVNILKQFFEGKRRKMLCLVTV